MTNHDYTYDINRLIEKDGETGAIASFALQLDSILYSNEPLNETGYKVLDEALKLLLELAEASTSYNPSEFEEGYREGYDDAQFGNHPQY